MTTAEQNERAAEFASMAGTGRLKLIEYQTLSGSERVDALMEAWNALVALTNEFELVLSDMQQTV